MHFQIKTITHRGNWFSFHNFNQIVLFIVSFKFKVALAASNNIYILTLLKLYLMEFWSKSIYLHPLDRCNCKILAMVTILNLFPMSSSFQVWVFVWMRSFTRDSSISSQTTNSLSKWEFGIHGSCHILTYEPFLISHQAPFIKTLLFIISVHTLDIDFEYFHAQNYWYCRYLVLKLLTQLASEFFRNLQPDLETKALLTIYVSCMPKFLLFLSCWNYLQAFK